MSILIKGVDMPENCHECEFVDILPTCPCNKMSDEDFWNNVSLAVEGHKDCPIIGVPPHGRLIDADAINHEDEIWKKKCIPPQVVYNAWVVAGEMPTVIPADEDGET